MVSRALRIFGLLLLIAGPAAAHERPLLPGEDARSLAGGWARQHEPGVRRSAIDLGARRAAPASQRAARHAQRRDPSGRVWSTVELRPARLRPGAGGTWTTQRVGDWSHSYSSDGIHCVSQRTAERVFISCQ